MAKVRNVSERGAEIEHDGRRTWVSWDLLRRAAKQPHQETARAYAELLDEAAKLSMRLSPVIVKWGQDETGVWWQAWVETAWGGFVIGRRWRGDLAIMGRDEGGTLPQAWMARQEAMNIAERVKRIDARALVDVRQAA